MTSDSTSAFRLYLESSLTTLGLIDQLLTLSSHQLVKRATKVSVKSLAHLQDKEALSKRSHAWLVLSSHGSLIPQLYLGAAVNRQIKAAFMKYRMGCLATHTHLPRWMTVNMPDTCRLCGLAPESLIHHICLCKSITADRNRLLRPVFLQRGLRRCRPAILAGFKGDDVQLSCRLAIFLDKLGRLLQETEQARLTHTIRLQATS
ncbi:hypothetical protein NDU88_006859 [Pleurodeles waltl]|uniref:Reverse transcriptase zinc-binding domain-containing protein n=1 Tax=Pleurodeles waltl TaxID=8319 RepID=A0AAV7QPU3_PLEWA|nr:hypothetical protein NDU88_006859 [Pleurodeles waltl]